VKTRRGVNLVVEALRRNRARVRRCSRLRNAEFALLIPDLGHDHPRSACSTSRAPSPRT